MPSRLTACLILTLFLTACSVPPTATPLAPTATLTALPPTATAQPTATQPPTTAPTRAPTTVAPSIALANLTGTWLSGQPFPADPNRVPHITLTLSEAASVLTGSFVVPLDDVNTPLASASVEGDRLRLEVPSPEGSLLYLLQPAGDALTGTVSLNDLSATVELIRLAPLTASDFAAFEGWYEAAPDHLLRVYLEGAAFMYRDYATGRLGQLLPISPTRFVGGPGRFVPYPVETHITFDDAGTLTLEQVGQPALTAHRISGFYTTEEVRFTNGDISLAGTLVLPARPGQPPDARHPAVIMLHGSNPQRRGDLYYRMRAEWLAHSGIAVLLYDKRGVGDSTGIYIERASNSNLDNLAGDGLAGVELLLAHPDIDPAQVGLMGDSQAGWIAPRIAAQSPRLAFMLMLVGPTTAPAQEELYMSLIGPVDLGYSSMTEEQVTQRVLEADGMGEFDPKDYLRATHLPALWLYGGLDRTVPSFASLAVLDELRAEGLTNHEYQLYPAANHSLYIARAGRPTDLAYLPGLHPDVYPAIRAWLLAHLTLS